MKYCAGVLQCAVELKYCVEVLGYLRSRAGYREHRSLLNISLLVDRANGSQGNSIIFSANMATILINFLAKIRFMDKVFSISPLNF